LHAFGCGGGGGGAGALSTTAGLDGGGPWAYAPGQTPTPIVTKNVTAKIQAKAAFFMCLFMFNFLSLFTEWFSVVSAAIVLREDNSVSNEIIKNS